MPPTNPRIVDSCQFRKNVLAEAGSCLADFDCGKGLEFLIYKHILIYMNEPNRLSCKGTLLLSALAVLAGLEPASLSFAAESAQPTAAAVTAAASVVVQAREVDLAFPVEATVEAVRQATVAAQVAGRVLDVRVDAGQR
jgi:hypothetical protein